MAEIVAGIGLPHTPGSPALVAREGPQCETARFYAEVAKQLEAVNLYAGLMEEVKTRLSAITRYCASCFPRTLRLNFAFFRSA